MISGFGLFLNFVQKMAVAKKINVLLCGDAVKSSSSADPATFELAAS